MPEESEALGQIRFLDLMPEEVREEMASLGRPVFRADQVLHWVYGRLVDAPEAMSNLSRQDREALAKRFVFCNSSISRRQVAGDSTVKLLLTWPDGRSAETVMIPDGPRRTACVSSQVGCPVGCRFCASGLAGLQANLSAGQIVEQVFILNRLLAEESQRITNIVFMGMGEPLANYANVTKAVRILHDPKAFNLGARRLTISTVGVPAKIRQLADEGLPINLALSLHAPNEPLRRELIPWAEHFALDEILDATHAYFTKTGREVTFEYILLAGVNDRADHAQELLKLCRGLRVNVNLIRYNEVPSLPYGRPATEDVLRFQSILKNGGINTHIRKSRGRDIDAACGQLRRREMEQKVALTVREKK